MMTTGKRLIEGLKKKGCKTMTIYPSWVTPATKYPLKKIRSAELIRKKYKEGIYCMEGVNGYDFFYVTDKIPVTIITINGKEVMVDEPSHQIGMKLLAKESKGKVLVGGLGLGLIIHALENNPEVKSIDVVDLNDDVIKLINPLIPHTKTTVYHGDVFDKRWFNGNYDTIILDLWVKGEDGDGRAGVDIELDVMCDMLCSYNHFKDAYPKSKIFIWGMRDKQINPAIKKELNSFCRDFIKRMEELERC